MRTWIIVLVVITAAMILRGFVFTYFYWRAGQLKRLVDRYWRKEVTWAEAGGRKREIVRLFKVAQIREPGIDLNTPMPGGVIHRTAGLFENIFLNRRDVGQLVHDAFIEARGYFKDEIRRSFIPLFWPSVVLSLPADALVYVGVSPESAAVRAAKVLAGIAAVGASIAAIIDAL